MSGREGRGQLEETKVEVTPSYVKLKLEDID